MLHVGWILSHPCRDHLILRPLIRCTGDSSSQQRVILAYKYCGLTFAFVRHKAYAQTSNRDLHRIQQSQATIGIPICMIA